MPQATSTTDYWFESDDPALTPGWSLIEFLISIGADEFTVHFRYLGGDGGGKDLCDQLCARLQFASIGQRTRELSVTFAGQANPRLVEVWRLDSGTLAVLRDVMPLGVGGPREIEPAAAEDLCVYRRGQLLFGTVSHEQVAYVRLTDVERERWVAWMVAKG